MFEGFLYDPLWYSSQIMTRADDIFMPLLKKEGHIALHMSVGMLVGRYVGIPQPCAMIHPECFAQEASNWVSR